MYQSIIVQIGRIMVGAHRHLITRLPLPVTLAACTPPVPQG